jgi:pyruvate,water dikinase
MGDVIALIVGDMLIRLIESIVTPIGDEIKGQTANSGKVKGIVRVIIRKEDVDKLQTGDVFVTDMTNPDISMAANKCSAIVTDKGGMLCHAAILSRELGVPCIVGTGNATRVLRDGDKVEVDATKGVVRKLELDED